MDDLDQHIADWDEKEPGFAASVDSAVRRKKMIANFVDMRKAQQLTQTAVAERMATTQSVVSDLERGSDVHLSTLQKYVAALGATLSLEAAE